MDCIHRMNTLQVTHRELLRHILSVIVSIKYSVMRIQCARDRYDVSFVSNLELCYRLLGRLKWLVAKRFEEFCFLNMQIYRVLSSTLLDPLQKRCRKHRNIDQASFTAPVREGLYYAPRSEHCSLNNWDEKLLFYQIRHPKNGSAF